MTRGVDPRTKDGTGLVQVIRAVTFSPEFTRSLFAAIRDQASKPYDGRTYEARLSQIYQRFTSDQLAAAAKVRCEGGA